MIRPIDKIFVQFLSKIAWLIRKYIWQIFLRTILVTEAPLILSI